MTETSGPWERNFGEPTITNMTTNGDRPGAHPPIEQYLEAIFNLEEEGNQVIQARLAERVGHSAPTVSEMVHRLRAGGFIDVSGRALSLTPSGRDVATSVIRKHRLAERLLTDVIGLEWHKVHAEADRWEHVISDDVEARLVEVLGHPTTCPHGNFIPGSGAAPQPAAALTEVEIGERAKLVRISAAIEFDADALLYLEHNGFVPGCEATVVAKGPDGSIVLDTGLTSIVLGEHLAKLLYAVPTGDADGDPGPSEQRQAPEAVALLR